MKIKFFKRIISVVITVVIAMSIVCMPVNAAYKVKIDADDTESYVYGVNASVGCINQRQNDEIVYTVSIPQDGQYQLVATTVKTNIATETVSSGYVTFEGEKTNFEYDYTGKTATDLVDVSLATLNMAKGTCSFSVIATSSRYYPVCYTLTKVGEYIHEVSIQGISGTPTPQSNTISGEKVATIRQGNTVTYSVTAPVSGQYKVVAKTLNPGHFNASWTTTEGYTTFDGEKINFSYSYAGMEATSFADVSLGTLNLAEGENSFSITVTSDRFYPVYFNLTKVDDYIYKVKIDDAYTDADETPYARNMVAGTSIYAVTQRENDKISYTVSIPQDGQYKLVATTVKTNVATETVSSGYVTFEGEKTNFEYDYTGKAATDFVDVCLATLNMAKGTCSFSVTATSYRYYPVSYTLTKVDEYIHEVKLHAYNDAVSGRYAQNLVAGTSNIYALTHRNTDTVTYTVTAPVSGQYKLVATTVKTNVDAEPIASGYVTFNDKKTDFEYDYTGKAATDLVEVELATLNMAEGANNFSVNVTSSRFYPVYYTLTKVGEYIHEISVDVFSGTPTPDTNASSGTTVGTIRKNTTVTYKVTVPVDGYYKLETKAINPQYLNMGEVTSGYVTFDGEKTDYSYSYQGMDALSFADFSLATLFLLEGENEFSITVTSDRFYPASLTLTQVVDSAPLAITIKSFENQKAVISSNNVETVTVIFAEYDGESLLDAETKEITLNPGDNNVSTKLSGSDIKVMVWNNLDDMIPLCKSKSLLD